MTVERVLHWVEQLPEEHRSAVLNEMSHVLGKTYVSEKRMGKFLLNAVQNKELTKSNPAEFWSDTELLDIQQRGASQREMLVPLRAQMNSLGIEPRPAGQDGTANFVYLDDCIFTGSHMLNDLTAWINDRAPEKATVFVLTTFVHAGALYRAKKAKRNLYEVARQANKRISLAFWRIGELEDRLWYSRTSDVLRPKAALQNVAVQAYINSLQPELEEAKAKYKKDFKLSWRDGDDPGAYGVFSSGAGRALLEDQLLIAGCEARLQCTNLIQSVRPLGYQYLTSLGFGGTVVTYRNCPNNCPLAWWAGDPWFPLFPRRTNTETAIEQFFQ